MLPRTKPSRQPKFQTSPPPSAPRPTIGSLPLRPDLRPVKTPPARSPPPNDPQRSQRLGLLALSLRRPTADGRTERPGNPFSPRLETRQKKASSPKPAGFPLHYPGRATPTPNRPENHPDKNGQPANPVPDPAPGQFPLRRESGFPAANASPRAQHPAAAVTRPVIKTPASARRNAAMTAETTRQLCAAPWARPASWPTGPSAGAAWVRSATTASAAMEQTRPPSLPASPPPPPGQLHFNSRKTEV